MLQNASNKKSSILLSFIRVQMKRIIMFAKLTNEKEINRNDGFIYYGKKLKKVLDILKKNYFCPPKLRK